MRETEVLFLISSPKMEAIIHTAHPLTTGSHQGSIPNAVLKKAIAKMNALIIRGTNTILTGLYLTIKKQQTVFTALTMKKPKGLFITSGFTKPSAITELYTRTSAIITTNTNPKLWTVPVNKLFTFVPIIKLIKLSLIKGTKNNPIKGN